MTPTYYDKQTKTVKAVEPTKPQPKDFTTWHGLTRDFAMGKYCEAMNKYDKAVASLPAPIPIAPGTDKEFEQMPNPIYKGVHYEVREKTYSIQHSGGDLETGCIEKVAYPLPQQEKQEDTQDEMFMTLYSVSVLYDGIEFIERAKKMYEIKKRTV